MQRKKFKENIMAVYEELKPVKTFMGKLKHDGDLIGELTKICLDNEIKLGKVEALGAVKKAKIGYYDQDRKEYNFLEIDRHLEIISLVGNVSLKDGKPIEQFVGAISGEELELKLRRFIKNELDE